MANLEQPAEQPGTSPELATMGGGCFWCLEGVYQYVRGVERVESGYAGGVQANPTYQEVCSGDTGHAEVVQVTFAPATITFREILEIFFGMHDPTTRNRQGADVGTQYRSVIFYHSPAQKAVAEQLIAELNEAKIWGRPIVTEVSPLQTFYKAEEYHQEYFQRNPYQPYCQAIVAPKVAKFRQHFASKLRT